MKNLLSDQAYLKNQYRDGANLDARIALHARFSTAARDWFDWYFDHLALPPDARVLEVGCGTGRLWIENRTRIPPTWRITLSDFSLGMVETARAASVVANFLQTDAQAIPFPNDSFDAVIANHMLYHVPDRPRALGEFARVLKPSGKLYAATNGKAHMREYFQLVSDFLGVPVSSPTEHFQLEDCAEEFTQFFSSVRRFDFADSLCVTEVEPLVAYAMSGFVGMELISRERQDALRQYIAERIARDGMFRITKATGLFVATD